MRALVFRAAPRSFSAAAHTIAVCLAGVAVCFSSVPTLRAAARPHRAQVTTGRAVAGPTRHPPPVQSAAVPLTAPLPRLPGRRLHA